MKCENYLPLASDPVLLLDAGLQYTAGLRCWDPLIFFKLSVPSRLRGYGDWRVDSSHFEWAEGASVTWSVKLTQAFHVRFAYLPILPSPGLVSGQKRIHPRKGRLARPADRERLILSLCFGTFVNAGSFRRGGWVPHPLSFYLFHSFTLHAVHVCNALLVY